MANTRMPRGAIPSPRYKLAAAMPHKVTGVTPRNYFNIPKKISYWGNDVHGDCVTAEEAFAKACNNPELFVSDKVAIKWATVHNFLEGAVLIDVLEAMVSTGFQQSSGQTLDDGPCFSVDWTNAALLNNAISKGPVKLGVGGDQLNDVYNANSAKNGWFATGFQPEPDEDHCVSLCGTGTIAWLAKELNVPVPAGVDGTQPGYGLFTWDSIGIIDVPSMLAITHEAWLRNPTTVIA